MNDSDGLGTLLAAQLGHARRAVATLTAERDAALAECATLRAQLAAAEDGRTFYMRLFCDTAGAAQERPQKAKKRGLVRR